MWADLQGELSRSSANFFVQLRLNVRLDLCGTFLCWSSVLILKALYQTKRLTPFLKDE